jgi:hypothetical protein
LAAVLADAHSLAGWQSLDRGDPTAAWEHYRRAGDAARAAQSVALEAHALAEQAVILADIGRTADSVTMSAHARAIGRTSPPLLGAWLMAAHGEALVADGQHRASLDAFDYAERTLTHISEPRPGMPYVTLDQAHLSRWRGHALARNGHPNAVAVLTAALARHDPEFIRAEAALQLDLAVALAAAGDVDGAVSRVLSGRDQAHAIGSIRQLRRAARLIAG